MSDIELILERDDNGAFRVVKQENMPVNYNDIDRGLIAAIIEVLDNL